MPRSAPAPREFGRRDVLQQGAAAAGLLWTAPALSTIRVAQDVGSPPPDTTSTTQPSPVLLTFAGTFAVRSQNVDLFDPSCDFARWTIDATADLDGQPPEVDLEPASLALDFCALIGFFEDGELLLDLPGGVLTGDLTSGTYTPRSMPLNPSELAMTFAVTAGTGPFAGATGSLEAGATWFGELPDGGTLTGSVVIPGA
jgi:hypothetical protein